MNSLTTSHPPGHRRMARRADTRRHPGTYDDGVGRTSGLNPGAANLAEVQMNPVFGEGGGTRLTTPFTPWLRTMQPPGMFWAGLDGVSSPLASKLVTLLRAAMRPARVGVDPAARRP